MSESSKVRLVGEPQAVPVFNCRVIVSPRDSEGNITARAAELEGLTAVGSLEREAIQKLVTAFKAHVAAIVKAGGEIPWRRPGDALQPGEKEFFVGVHL